MVYAPYWRDGLKMAYDHHPDLVILDIMMPEMDGYEVCKRLQEMSDVPILMLTAKAEKDDLLRGFQAGAADYLTKPFIITELEYRIRALLKHTNNRSRDEVNIYEYGSLKVDLKQGRVFRDNEQVPLTPTEFRLLSYLIRNRGTVIGHEELIRRVWGTGYLLDPDGGKASLQLYISYLRDKIEDDPKDPYFIRTKWGVGYFWYVPETEVQP